MPPKPPRSNHNRPIPRTVEVSKALSFLLRHGAERAGIALDEGGWCNVADVLGWSKLAKLKVSLPELQEIVASNDKKRFEMIVDSSFAPSRTKSKPQPRSKSPPSSSSSQAPHHQQQQQHQSRSRPNGNLDAEFYTNPANFLIRAAQGHTVTTVTSEALLRPLRVDDPDCPVLVVHGTYRDKWLLIQESGGLKPMARRHIHFARGIPRQTAPPVTEDSSLQNPSDAADEQVVSGMRKNCNVLLWVNVKESMIQDRVQWYVSSNGVILTEGIDDNLGSGQRHLPLKWIVYAEDRGTGAVISGDVERGRSLGARLQAEDSKDTNLSSLEISKKHEDEAGVRGDEGRG